MKLLKQNPAYVLLFLLKSSKTRTYATSCFMF